MENIWGIPDQRLGGTTGSGIDGWTGQRCHLLSVGMGWILGTIFWIAAGALAWFAVRIFNRPKLLH